MNAALLPYTTGLIAVASMLLLTLVQQFMAATAKNVIKKDSTAGIPIATGHDDFGFRAERAHANTLENLPVFVFVVFLAVAVGVSPSWLNILTSAFLGFRVLHMIVYYAGVAPVRTLSFLGGFLSTAAIVVMSLIKLFAG